MANQYPECFCKIDCILVDGSGDGGGGGLSIVGVGVGVVAYNHNSHFALIVILISVALLNTPTRDKKALWLQEHMYR